MLKTLLEKIGLNTPEALVYLACLRLGTQDVGMISKESGLSRQDSIIALNNLMERGFVSKFSSQKDFFTPEHPEVLVNILENNKSEIEEKIRVFHDAIPEFLDYMNPAFSKPEIVFYQGKEGVIAAYEDTLTAKEGIMAIASVDDIETCFPKYVPKYYKRRKAASIHISAIFPDSKMSRERKALDEQELRTSRLIPKDMMDFHMEMNIYNDKVAYFSIKEQLACIIKSEVIADSMRNVFNLCWKMAELYEPNAAIEKAKKENVQKKSRPKKSTKQAA